VTPCIEEGVPGIFPSHPTKRRFMYIFWGVLFFSRDDTQKKNPQKKCLEAGFSVQEESTSCQEVSFAR
jgi:hypothetical protein